jgi:O-antigen/teichoic acid export membrane protein
MRNSDYFYSISRSILGPLQLFVLSLLVIHFTSLSNWGAFISIYLVWSVCVLLINSGTKEFLVKSISLNPSSIWLFASNNTSIRFIFSLLSALVVLFIPLGSTPEKVMMMSVIVLRVFTSTFEGLIVYQKVFKQSFFAELISLLLICILTAIGKYYGFLQPVYILAYIVMGDIFKMVIYEHNLKLFKNYSFNSFSVLRSIKELLPFLGAGILGLVMNKADLYIFGLFITDKELIAQYHILNTFSNLLLITVSAALSVRNKVIFRVSLNKLKTIQRVYLKYSLGLILSGGISFYLLSPFLFQYKITHVQLLLIMLTVLLFSSYALYIYVLLRVDKMKQVNSMVLVSGVTNVVLNILLIPYYQIEGALMAVTISNMVMLFLTYRKVRAYIS